jgi:hypothetical protein
MPTAHSLAIKHMLRFTTYLSWAIIKEKGGLMTVYQEIVFLAEYLLANNLAPHLDDEAPSICAEQFACLLTLVNTVELQDFYHDYMLNRMQAW